MKLKIILMAAWWDYYNNYLTHKKFGDDHGLSPAFAKHLTDKGHTLWNRATLEEREAAIKYAKKGLR
jgi:hypothetical protein